MLGKGCPKPCMSNVCVEAAAWSACWVGGAATAALSIGICDGRSGRTGANVGDCDGVCARVTGGTNGNTLDGRWAPTPITVALGAGLAIAVVIGPAGARFAGTWPGLGVGPSGGATDGTWPARGNGAAGA